MKAYLNDGKGIGSEHSTITGEYKTFINLYRFAIYPFVRKHNHCKVELFYNWDNRYDNPDKTIVYTVKNGMILREDLSLKR